MREVNVVGGGVVSHWYWGQQQEEKRGRLPSVPGTYPLKHQSVRKQGKEAKGVRAVALRKTQHHLILQLLRLQLNTRTRTSCSNPNDCQRINNFNNPWKKKKDTGWTMWLWFKILKYSSGKIMDILLVIAIWSYDSFTGWVTNNRKMEYLLDNVTLWTRFFFSFKCEMFVIVANNYPGN